MAGKAFEIGLALAPPLMMMMMMISGLASAQSSGCTTVVITLAPCLSYISGNSSKPSLSCCTQLALVVRSQPVCFCAVVVGGASSFGITINQTRALAMPAACNVQTPPDSECSAVAGPVKSPTPPADPAPSPQTAERGSKATPGTSDGSSYKSTRSLMLSFLFLVAGICFTNL